MKNLISLALITLALSACGSSPTPAPTTKGDSTAGQSQFTTTCVTCHGPDAKGLPGLGKDLTTSEFVASKTDDEMVTFLKTGRSTSDPANTTGVDMPPRGGNPALTDNDLYDIVAYLRSIHQK